MNRRGWNLKRGQPDGDRGRSLGGSAHAARNNESLDDSERTHSQYWGQVGFVKLIEQLGSEDKARRYMSDLGVKAYAKERRAFSRYLYQMRNSQAINQT